LAEGCFQLLAICTTVKVSPVQVRAPIEGAAMLGRQPFDHVNLWFISFRNSIRAT
jgi:hypothetical protein